MSHKDPVTKEMWERVITRDLWEIMRATQPTPNTFDPWTLHEDWLYTEVKNVYDQIIRERAIRAAKRGRICVAPFIDFSESQKCSGRTTLDHIKDEQRMGVRAPSDIGHLVSLCEGHTEAGMKAGRQWNTAHRKELREYLRRVNAG